jgi:hypothetical protein
MERSAIPALGSWVSANAATQPTRADLFILLNDTAPFMLILRPRGYPSNSEP